jgi:hypothetical protein
MDGTKNAARVRENRCDPRPAVVVGQGLSELQDDLSIPSYQRIIHRITAVLCMTREEYRAKIFILLKHVSYCQCDGRFNCLQEAEAR